METLWWLAKTEEPMLSSSQQILSNGDQSVKAQRLEGLGHAGLVVLIEGLMQWNGWKHHNMKGDETSRCDAMLLEGLGGLESASERSGEAQEHPSTWSTAYLDRTAQVPLAASTLGSSCFSHPEKDVAILVYSALHLSSCAQRSLTSFSEFVEKALFFCRATDPFGMRWCTLSLCRAVRASGRGMPLCPWFSAFA